MLIPQHKLRHDVVIATVVVVAVAAYSGWYIEALRKNVKYAEDK